MDEQEYTDNLIDGFNQCWAHNVQGQRCEEEAGHQSRHVISVTWTDDEVWTPLAERPVSFAVPGTIHTEASVYPRPPQVGESNVCLICDHVMHKGVCGHPLADSDICDCKAGIPK